LLDSPALGGMTPAYASPQMLDGEEPQPADDVFALAIVALELLTGRHPFDYERPDAPRLAAVKATPLHGLKRPQRNALLRALALERASRHGNASAFLREFDGSSRAKRFTQLGSAAAIAMPIAAFLVSGQNEGPTVPFEDLTPEVRAGFERAITEGQTALSFGAAGINEALLYFSSAYELHPGNPRAVSGLETVADRFIASLPDADARTRAEVFGVLECNPYLRRYEPVKTACRDTLGASQCESIAASCGLEPRE
jgi:serine/threonine protein kinase